MKAILRTSLLFVSIIILGITVAKAQRVISGTVYTDGKPAAGITVEIHKGESMLTSFDGKYKLKGSHKSKWIKFTFIDDTKKLSIEDKPGDTFDFAYSGELPSKNASSESGSKVNLSKLEDLVKAKDNTFLNALSLYSEFYKQKDYKSAMPHWEKLYNNYPASTPNLYIQGAKMLESKIKNAKTDTDRDALLDQYMKLYDKRIKYFGNKGFVLGRKATSWLKYKLAENRENPPEGDELKAIHKSGYEWLSQSVKEQGDETEPSSLILFMQTTVALFKLGEIPKEQVVKNYEKSTGIANSIVKANKDDKAVKQIQEKVLPYVDEIFGKSGAADCEALLSIYTEEFNAKKDDSEYIKSMLRRLGRAGCTESDLFAQGTERLYHLDPSAEAAFNMARRYLKKNDIENTKKYYKMAMEQEEDQDLLATYYYEYALFIFAKENSYSEARSYARKALAINKNYCEANMLIGNIYAAASRSFKGNAIEKAAVFWVACDYFNRARKGEDCSIDAANSAAKYRRYFPNKEDAFMEGLQSGATHKVGGWINETTRVRF